MRHLFWALALILLAAACQSEPANSNPPADGFDLENSDPEAIAVADAVMEAMGGRTAWDTTRYLSWNFFGKRFLIWDKTAQRVRIEAEDGTWAIAMNYADMTGQVMLDGQLVTAPDTLQEWLQKGRSMWINDAYWLVMPYKLKDSGVTLKYLGPGQSEDGRDAEILQLTFKSVGDTPHNKYHVWVDRSSAEVCQWAYFPNASDSLPSFTTPWEGYQNYGSIRLAGGRGERSLTEIAVYDELPEELFRLP